MLAFNVGEEKLNEFCRLLRARPRCRAAEIGIRVVSTILEPAEGKR
jgi:hypothetical protein